MVYMSREDDKEKIRKKIIENEIGMDSFSLNIQICISYFRYIFSQLYVPC